MSAWFVKNLGDAMLASEMLTQMAAQFEQMRKEAGSPPDMALFYRHESGRLHCQVMAYLSPAAADFARRIGAMACARPSREGLDLSVGAEECWSILFPEGVGGEIK